MKQQVSVLPAASVRRQKESTQTVQMYTVPDVQAVSLKSGHKKTAAFSSCCSPFLSYQYFINFRLPISGSFFKDPVEQLIIPIISRTRANIIIAK